MKNLFVFLLVGILGLIASGAQAQQGSDKLRAQAAETTRQLASRIALDDARTMQVRRATYDRLVEESQVNTMYSDDPAMRQNKLQAIEQEYAEKLKGILTEAQYARYAATAAPPAAPAKSVISAVQPGTEQ